MNIAQIIALEMVNALLVFANAMKDLAVMHAIS
jgi:hypothetical protein